MLFAFGLGVKYQELLNTTKKERKKEKKNTSTNIEVDLLTDGRVEELRYLNGR